jgi:starvation-inducible DNA-binding protein
MATITGPLSGEARNTVAEALQGALVDLVDLSLVAKQMHWNVVGHNFRAVHFQLDELVALAREHADTVAERAAALGINPDGRAATLSRATRISQPESGWIEAGKVVATMTEILEGVGARMRERIEATDQPDKATQDLFIRIAQDIDKERWMFQAQR